MTFALAGLYLFVEKGFTGRQVQEAHVRMAACKKTWPVIHLPSRRGQVTIRQVLDARPGKERDVMIKLWAASVWEAYGQDRPSIVKLIDSYSDILANP